jgi:hypothetical protein
MKQTDHEADEALAHIRRNTAVPIQRFFDSLAAARLEETTSQQNRNPTGPSKLGRSGAALGLRRLLEAISFSLKSALGAETFARVIRRICRHK